MDDPAASTPYRAPTLVAPRAPTDPAQAVWVAAHVTLAALWATHAVCLVEDLVEVMLWFGCVLMTVLVGLPVTAHAALARDGRNLRRAGSATLVWGAWLALSFGAHRVTEGARQREERRVETLVSDAVLRYRAERGVYPPALEALVPRYLRAIPTLSPAGPHVDRRFEYERYGEDVFLKHSPFVPSGFVMLDHYQGFDFNRRVWVDCQSHFCSGGRDAHLSPRSR